VVYVWVTLVSANKSAIGLGVSLLAFVFLGITLVTLSRGWLDAVQLQALRFYAHEYNHLE